MKRRSRTGVHAALAGLAAALLLSACTVEPIDPARFGGAVDCPVTQPNGAQPPGESVDSPEYHGNGVIWTALWPDGVVWVEPSQVDSLGRPTMKWPWWRGVEGALELSGRRLDRTAPPMQAQIPDGYEPTGFQPSGLIFSQPGCWEVTARLGEASLTFVTEVRLQRPPRLR